MFFFLGSTPLSAELNEKDEMPNFMIIGITSAAMVLLILNAALVAWFVIRRQNKNANEVEAPNDDAYSKEDNQSVYKVGFTILFFLKYYMNYILKCFKL